MKISLTEAQQARQAEFRAFADEPIAPHAAPLRDPVGEKEQRHQGSDESTGHGRPPQRPRSDPRADHAPAAPSAPGAAASPNRCTGQDP